MLWLNLPGIFCYFNYIPKYSFFKKIYVIYGKKPIKFIAKPKGGNMDAIILISEVLRMSEEQDLRVDIEKHTLSLHMRVLATVTLPPYPEVLWKPN